MPDPSPSSDSNGDIRVRPTAQRPPATPRWVVMFGIVALVLVALVVVAHLTGLSPAGHGP
jgi:hypothetical protein